MDLIFRLRQHTPLIHFQHDQKGATLRATDFKPKFDKYIRKKENLRDDNLLRYQLKIRALDECEPDDPDRDGLFFGNLGSSQKKMELKNKHVELRFNTYFNHNLATIINNSLHEFLARENFGSRSNKGYGSFFDESKRREDFESSLKRVVAPASVYFWDCQFNDIFFSIKTFYMLLKSGINYPPSKGKQGTYYKSLLFCYMKNKGITWDKKALKSHFLPHARSHKFETNNKKFVRGLFGVSVSEIQSWRSYGKTLKINCNDDTDDTIERVPSPVTFKVFVDDRNKARVYFYIKPLESEILGKQFTFEMRNTGKPPLKLITPSLFDGEDYIAWAVKEINTQLKVNTSGDKAHRADKILRKLQQEGIKKL